MHAGAAWPTRDGVVGDADAETWRVGSSAGEGDSEIKVKVKTEKSKRAAGPGGVRSTTYCIHV